MASTEKSVLDPFARADSRRKGTGVELSDDEALLANLGYKQEFKREFSRFELLGVSIICLSNVPALASVLVYAIPNGGPSAMVWGWAACAIFTFVVSLAFAELGSAMPTSGGLYYWTFTYSSRRWRCLLSWIVGYSNTIGMIAGLASVDWGLAIQIVAAASIGSEMRFIPTTGQIFGIYIVTLFSHAVLCSLATRIMARLQHFYMVLNLILCLAIIIGIPAATPSEFKNTSSYAFGEFVNLNGWPNGYAFILSFLAPVWAFGVYDTTVHISEEAANARSAVPFSIISSVVIAGVVGWVINIVLAFNMGTEIEAILSDPIGQPMAVILLNSVGKHATLAIWSLLIVCQFAMGSNVLLASSRQTFAFARDGGLPFSRYIYRINPYTKSPVVGVWMAVFICVLLGLLAFAGPEAIAAVFSIAIAGQNLAYILPVAARLTSKKQDATGPYSLGKLRAPIQVFSIAWMSFMIVVSMFPTNPNPDVPSMNYTSVVLGSFLGLALLYYFCPVYGGIYWFKGPQRTLEVPLSGITNEEEGSIELQPSGMKSAEKIEIEVKAVSSA